MRNKKSANFGEPSIKPELPGFFPGYEQHDDPTLKQMKTVFDNASFSLPKSGLDKLIAYHSTTQDKLEEMFGCFPANLDKHQKYKYLREELKKAKDVFYGELDADSNFRRQCQWLTTTTSRQNIVQNEISEWTKDLNRLVEYLGKFSAKIRTLKNSLVDPKTTGKYDFDSIKSYFENILITTEEGVQLFYDKWNELPGAENPHTSRNIERYVYDEVRREIREIQLCCLLNYSQFIKKCKEIQCLINFLIDVLNKVGATHEILEPLEQLKNCVVFLIPSDEQSKKTIGCFINFIAISKSPVSQLFFKNYYKKLGVFKSLYKKLDLVRDELTQQELKFFGKRKADNLAYDCKDLGDQGSQKIQRLKSPDNVANVGKVTYTK
jgi:hypothetical protein